MKKEIISKLIKTKIIILFLPSYKRQKHINSLYSFINSKLSEFNEKEVEILKEEISYLTEKERDKLFTKFFFLYKFIKFGKARLEIDDYNPRDCRTFEQFNDIVRLAFLAIDCEELFLS